MKKEISRQRKWQIKMEKGGRCMICGKKAVVKSRCQKHRIERNKRDRIYQKRSTAK